MKKNNKIFLFMGPPGSGKGTLSALCVEQFGWNQVSTGNLCRTHIQTGSAIGQEIKAIIDKGQLVPDHMIIEMLQDWMMTQGKIAQNVIFDGYPRTVKQAELLYTLVKNNLKEYEIQLVKFLVDKDALLERILTRVICSNKDCQRAYSLKNAFFEKTMKCDFCGALLIKRADDTQGTLENRLDAYYQHEQEIIDFFVKHGISIIEIQAGRSIDEVFQDFKASIELV